MAHTPRLDEPDIDHVGPRERGPELARQLLDVVAGDELEPHVDADFIETLGDEQRVRVHAERRQHLGADGDDAGSHYPITRCARATVARRARFA